MNHEIISILQNFMLYLGFETKKKDTFRNIKINFEIGKIFRKG